MTTHNTNITPQELAEMSQDEFWPTLDKVAAGKIEVSEKKEETIDFGAPTGIAEVHNPAFQNEAKSNLPDTHKLKQLPRPPTGKYINVMGMGMWTKERFEEGKRTGAIVERNKIWCVTTEEKLIGVDEKGKNLKMPIKVRVPSDAWNNFNNKYKNK